MRVAGGSRQRGLPACLACLRFGRARAVCVRCLAVPAASWPVAPLRLCRLRAASVSPPHLTPPRAPAVPPPRLRFKEIKVILMKMCVYDERKTRTIGGQGAAVTALRLGMRIASRPCPCLQHPQHRSTMPRWPGLQPRSGPRAVDEAMALDDSTKRHQGHAQGERLPEVARLRQPDCRGDDQSLSTAAQTHSTWF